MVPLPEVPIIQHVQTTSDTITPELLRQLSAQAREMLQSVPVSPYCIHRVKKKDIIEGRQIGMALYSPKNHQLEIAHIGLCYKEPEKLTVLTSGYDIQWISGRGITRFIFSAHRPPERLIWVDGKQWMNETEQGEYYFPFTNDFMRQELVDDGAQFLMHTIDKAKSELCSLGVKSRSLEGKRLCDVIPSELIFNLAINEQSDDEEFFSKCPDLQSLPPENRIFANCPEYATAKALIHYARNREHAFGFVASSAGARGALQFMPSTYASIVRRYPDAHLITNFETGTQNLTNLIKAALCLLDEDLLGLNNSVRQEFLHNHRTGGMYLMAAYNGGLGNAERLWRSLHVTLKKPHSKKYRKQNKTVAKETSGYVSKYIALWPPIDEIQNRIDKY